MSVIKYFLLIGILFQVITNLENHKLKSIEDFEVNIFTLNTLYDDYLQIPDDENYPKMYQIDLETCDKFEKISGYSININDLGTVTPKNTTRYYYANGSISGELIPGLEINQTDITFSNGLSVINCTKGDHSYFINISVLDYARYYSEETLKKYVDEHVINVDSKYDQFKLITEYAASYPYCSDYQSFITLVIIKCGDSWATTSAIEFMARYAKLNAHMRVSENDPDNDPKTVLSEVALIDNKYYVSKVLYNQSENYTIFEIPQGYSIKESDEGEDKIIIYQYDGFEEEIKIPEKINDKTVIGIDKGCFLNGAKYAETDITSIIIPETITFIGDFAFSEIDIETITIPKSINTIGTHVFEGSSKLKEIIVDSENNQYSSENGILYDKNKKKLLYYPSGKDGKEFNTTENIHEISSFSFYKNKNLAKVFISKNVTKIGDQAFGDSEIEEFDFEGEPPTFGKNPFLYLSIKIKYFNSTNWEDIKQSFKDFGDFGITWKPKKKDKKEEEEPPNDENNDEEEDDKKNSNTLVYVLICVGIIVIIVAIIIIILLKKRGNSSSNIESIGEGGLISERNELT